NRLGGSRNKWQYYVCHQYKKGNGWRPNGDFKLHSFYGSIKYHLNESSSLGIELTKYNYNAHQPGGLTDFLFEQGASQSIRERNWFGVDWNILALSFDHKFSNGDKLNTRFFGLKGNRRSLGYLGMISRTDPLTDRDLIIGEYLNIGNETRWVQKYSIGNILGTFLLGGRIYKGNTNNKQGYGNDGFDADYDFNNINDLEGSDYEFPSDNISIFLENYMAFNEHWTITPGVRYETINTKSFGYFKEIEKDLAGNIIFEQNIYDTIKQDRQLVLLGLGASYKLGDMEVYANFSQNYRAINFTDLRVNNPNLEVDKDIKDERGFNTDIGFRGRFFKAINYDISFFCLYYRDRIGEMYRVDSSTFRLYRYRTNVADSRNVGIECLIELNILRLIKKQKKDIQLSVFGNAALINAKYLNAFENAIEGKLVELVPNITFKGGLEFKYKNLSCSVQNAFTGSHYTDATNAEYTSSAIGGLIPAYNVIDISLGYEKGKFIVETGINNALNAIYFTRRATSYPGPGIIPADPRNIYFTIGLKL
ncbi:MAG TPA: TonB-dependent receptor, partial [Bacteroidetes bacterium]|nr:TonB-dependent receptor [Bacteroidota bacterium]